VARVQALLRRVDRAAAQAAGDQRIVLGDLEIDPGNAG
jgi:DNA-binding response OmpR family regulator